MRCPGCNGGTEQAPCVCATEAELAHTPELTLDERWLLAPRDEDMHEANRHALFTACPAIFPKGGVSPRPRENRPSARNLAAYVERIIEQVSAL